MKTIKILKKVTVLLFLAMLFIALNLQAEVKTSGYIQTTMTKAEDNDAFLIGFDRVRARFSGSINDKVDFKLQVDFIDGAKATGNDGSTPGMINYAEIIYKLPNKMNLSVGKMKTPLGMEWNTGPTSLDFAKRGLGQAFIFHFDGGAMLYKNNIGKAGLGFAAGVFNYGPNKATNVGDPAQGPDYTLTGRVSADPNKQFHAEAYFGTAMTSVDGQENVTLAGVGAKWKPVSKLQLKGEYMSRDDAQNPSAEGTDYYVQAGYQVHPNFEPAVKYEQLDLTNDASDRTDLTVGLNIFINPEDKKQSKIIINYIASDLDGKDAIHLFYQVAF